MNIPVSGGANLGGAKIGLFSEASTPQVDCGGVLAKGLFIEVVTVLSPFLLLLLLLLFVVLLMLACSPVEDQIN